MAAALIMTAVMIAVGTVMWDRLFSALWNISRESHQSVSSKPLPEDQRATMRTIRMYTFYVYRADGAGMLT